MGLFKGISQGDLLERSPRFLCALLGEQLALTNKAVEAQNEEIRQLRKKLNEHTVYPKAIHSLAEAAENSSDVRYILDHEKPKASEKSCSNRA